MNEELKIVIKAVTADIEKKLEEVRKELEKVGKEGEESGKKVDKGLSAMGKAAMTAVAAVAAVGAAIINLGKSSIEFQKSQARLVSGFQSVGASAEQAKTTYKELYAFLGETDTATEAANLLAQITTGEKELTEWTEILKGVYATFPDSLPVEALAESINESINSGKIVGNLADSLVWLGVSEDAVNQKLAETNSLAEREAMLRSMLTGLYGNAAAMYDVNNSSITNMNKAQADLDFALAEATHYITPLLAALSSLGATLLQTCKPAIETIAAAFIVLVEWIAAAANAISAFFGGAKSSGKSAAGATNDVAKSLNTATASAGGLNSALDTAAGAAKELKKQTMGFDELNVVGSGASGGGGGAGAGAGGGISAGGFEVPQVDMDMSGADTFSDTLENVREKMEAIGVVAGIAGSVLAGWKIADLVKNSSNLSGNFKKIGGSAMMIGGALLAIDGYSKAWVDGIDWANFAEIIAGIGLVIGGATLAFGGVAGAIATIAGGIALVVLGIKDLVDNGYSIEGVVTVAVGAITLLVGVIWALNSALLANPITWVVAAIMALVAVFVILWNECDGFRQFWLDLWDAIVVAFEAVVAWFEQAGKDIAQFFVDAWNWIKEAWANVTQFFSDIWQGIKDTFSAVGKWFSNIFSGAWQGIKDAWSAVKQWFKNCWQGIKDAFSSVKTWFSDIFSGAWQGIKNAFSAVGDFFSGIWETIKSTFTSIGDTIGTAVSNAFSKAVNWVLEKAIGIINGFIGAINLAIDVINLIPGVELTKISKLEVPKLAKGGVIDGATLALIGEQGKEAVVPLENNTEWIDKLADRLAEKNGTPSKIVLMLDGNELGWASIHSINSITQQTGTLQLKV